MFKEMGPRQKRWVLVAAVAVVVLVIIAVGAFSRAGVESGQVIVRMAGLEPGKEVASPAVAYLVRRDDGHREQVTDCFEIAPEGNTVVTVSEETTSEEPLCLILVQPPVYADGSIYKEPIPSHVVGSYVNPVQGFLFFGPAQTTFEVNMSDYETVVPTVNQVSFWIEYWLQESWSSLESARRRLSNMVDEMSARDAAETIQEYEISESEDDASRYEDDIAARYEDRIARHEAHVIGCADLLKRADALDDTDVEGAIAIYKEWCSLYFYW